MSKLSADQIDMVHVASFSSGFPCRLYSADMSKSISGNVWQVDCFVSGLRVETFKVATEELATLVSRGFCAQTAFDDE